MHVCMYAFTYDYITEGMSAICVYVYVYVCMYGFTVECKNFRHRDSISGAQCSMRVHNIPMTQTAGMSDHRGHGHGHGHGLFIWMIKINDGPASKLVQGDHGCLQPPTR
jgi:hypothetical protein